MASIVELIWLMKFQESYVYYKNQLKISRMNGEFFKLKN